MSDHLPRPDITVEEMWDAWLPTATRGARLSRPEIGRIRIAYYAGVHNMLAKTLAILRIEDADVDSVRRLLKEAADELSRFSTTYRGE